MCFLSVFCAFWVCFVRVLPCICDESYLVHSTFSALHVRKHMLTASVSVADHRKKQYKYTHKTRKHCAIFCFDLCRN